MAWETYDGASGAIAETIVREVWDDISILAPMRFPLLGMLLPGARDIGSTRVEWLDESVRPRTVTTNSSGTDSAAATSITLSATAVNTLLVGDVLRVRSAGGGVDELILVTAISTSVITVTRGYSGTTAAAIVPSTVLELSLIHI